MDRYALFGYPVSHSRSPEIHHEFARQTGEDLVYEKIEVPEQLSTAVLSFFAAGGLGGNVTLPHKQAALELASTVTGRARRAGAVNTLVAEEDGILGDNTDGAGLVRDLRYNNDIALRGMRILVIGASGAARGILGPLLAEDPAMVDIINRTPEKAAGLAADFSDACCRGGGLDRAERNYDLVINATSASLDNALPDVGDSIFGPQATAVDLVYQQEETIFLQWAKAAGVANRIDGWGMLVEQAAEAFELWRGERPLTKALLGESFRRGRHFN